MESVSRFAPDGTSRIGDSKCSIATQRLRVYNTHFSQALHSGDPPMMTRAQLSLRVSSSDAPSTEAHRLRALGSIPSRSGASPGPWPRTSGVAARYPGLTADRRPGLPAQRRAGVRSPWPVTRSRSPRRAIDALLVTAGWAVRTWRASSRKCRGGRRGAQFPFRAARATHHVVRPAAKRAGRDPGEEGRRHAPAAWPSRHALHAGPARSLARWADRLRCSTTSPPATKLHFRDTPAIQASLAPHLRLPPASDALHGWLKEFDTLRSRLRQMPPLGRQPATARSMPSPGRRNPTADDRSRSLIQMATGAGKTLHRLQLRLAAGACQAKRILFPGGPAATLGDQTLKSTRTSTRPALRLFDKTYVVQHLHGNRIDPDAKVVITTIQRLRHARRGTGRADEEGSAFKLGAMPRRTMRASCARWSTTRPSRSNIFDVIVTDECHPLHLRPVAPGAGVLRRPPHRTHRHALGTRWASSRRNLVAEYPTEQSVVDGVNVGFGSTASTHAGHGAKAARWMPAITCPCVTVARGRCATSSSMLTARTCGGTSTPSVTVPDQIRLVLQTYREEALPPS